MAWPRGNPVEEIDGLILRHRNDQIAWQHQLEDAAIAEVRALGALQAAQDLQERARQAIALDTAEIDRLFAEREVYVPRQREASE
jgi:hypothetical protein